MPQIEIYTSPLCGYCHAAKRLLEAKGAGFVEYDVARNPALRQEMMSRANGRHTVPQIFIGTRHIGGFDDMAALDRAGKLDPLLSES
jgi:glutaredoxin 3